MIVSNGIADIQTKRQAHELAKEMTKQVLHESAGLTWVKTTQSFLSGAILYVKDKYKTQVRLSDVKAFVSQSEKKEGFLEHITDQLEKNHPSYHAFRIMLTCKEYTRALVLALSGLCMRAVKE
ncbi:hypothetical protein P9027_29390 [Bacillus thuringiensis]|uniref:hypothetical protein n=1 Tax=Bacillus thuringiensis TaxID=1428 RepID=UPI002DB6A321|nr:hypothetical protein [Bacillus thuringiensis]MEC3226035.1 hypothetical protein [Bacillus thuringiensis]MEC3463378.1 hypothetical protein [Bacillus thuringiensis]MEC3554664.1 hypothetical protein [Bacillus thuringiensis]MED2056809.1 hypothetical protein [Bacillus thuringiensis]